MTPDRSESALITGVDSSALLAYYQSRSGGTGSSAVSTGSSANGSKNPTPPWGSRSQAAPANALVDAVMGGKRFVDVNAAKLDVGSAAASSSDYKNLFALYQGLNALQGLSDQYNAKTTTTARKAELSAKFDAGMKEVQSFLDTTKFSKFQLAQNLAQASAQTSIGAPRETDSFVTDPLHTGATNTAVAAFQGPVAFNLSLTKPSGSVVNVAFDLSEMGSTPRTMGNVVNYLNDKMQTAGAASRFAVVRTAGAERTTTAGKQTISLGTDPDSYALKFVGLSTEVAAFSAPAAAPAVYIGSTSGLTTGTAPKPARELLKFETGGAALASDAADGKVFEDGLGAEVQATRASATAADGSLYVLADVNNTTSDGQAIKGSTDVVLRKYDSAGELVFTRTLGAANNAAGYALSISADGSRVAVGGSVTGALDSGTTGADATAADSFVSVFDAHGQQLWSQRQGATGDDRVQALSFGADGTLYVSGAASASMNGQTALGSQDGYVQAYGQTTTGYSGKFTVQYGTASSDKPAGVAVSGSSLYVAGVEAGHAVVRRYDLQPTGAPTLGAVRDLGDLQGGSIAGVSIADDGSVVVGGSTQSGALSAGTVTTAYGGGSAAFVANLSSTLSANSGERLSFFGGTGDLTTTAMTLAGGKAYITGQVVATPLPGQTSAFDGYAAAIDPTTGAVSWSQSFRGADRMAAPSTIAVDTTGASVLDRLGLPHGTVDYARSTRVSAVTSARAGDQFYVRVAGGSAVAVTLDETDTLQTLADKVERASGFAATATVVTVNGQDRLKIVPASTRTPVEIEAGKAGRDMLESLGLAEGLVTTATDPNAKDQVKASYSLKLPSTISLTTSSRQAQSLLLDALSTVRGIYRDMTAPPAATSANSGKVPAYLTAQIASYQDALRRLTGS